MGPAINSKVLTYIGLFLKTLVRCLSHALLLNQCSVNIVYIEYGSLKDTNIENMNSLLFSKIVLKTTHEQSK